MLNQNDILRCLVEQYATIDYLEEALHLEEEE